MSRSTHEDGVTAPCVLKIVNKGKSSVRALWVDFNAREQEYMCVSPGHARPQQTYSTHLWRLRCADTGAIAGEYAGPSAILEVQPSGALSVRGWSDALPQPKPEWGQYCKRGDALGVEIWSYECVDPRAVRVAEHVVSRMLADSPPDVLERMVAGGAVVAIIGRRQVTTDIPAHAFMRWSEGGRDTDSTTRGLGGTSECPTTSCGEENLLMEDDESYPSENILVHEFGHAVMNIGLTAEDRATIRQLYDTAYRTGMYDKGAYIMENEDEYWAEGTQAWFDATIRTDVTAGINTRERLRQHDPGLAAMMRRAYGDGPWRYPDDAPAPFSHKRGRSRQQQAPGAESAQAGGGEATAAAVPLQQLQPPGVETAPERERLVAWSGAGPNTWLGSCVPYMPCAGVGLTQGSVPVGCATGLWVSLRDMVVGHTPHSTVKLS